MDSISISLASASESGEMQVTNVVHSRDRPSAGFSKTSSRVRDPIILALSSGPMVGSAGGGGGGGEGPQTDSQCIWMRVRLLFPMHPMLIRIGIPSDRNHCILYDNGTSWWFPAEHGNDDVSISSCGAGRSKRHLLGTIAVNG